MLSPRLQPDPAAALSGPRSSDSGATQFPPGCATFPQCGLERFSPSLKPTKASKRQNSLLLCPRAHCFCVGVTSVISSKPSRESWEAGEETLFWCQFQLQISIGFILKKITSSSSVLGWGSKCQSIHVEVMGQLVGRGSLLPPRGSQVLLPTEPFTGPSVDVLAPYQCLVPLNQWTDVDWVLRKVLAGWGWLHWLGAIIC